MIKSKLIEVIISMVRKLWYFFLNTIRKDNIVPIYAHIINPIISPL